jgi:hypothetical protein
MLQSLCLFLLILLSSCAGNIIEPATNSSLPSRGPTSQSSIKSQNSGTGISPTQTTQPHELGAIQATRQSAKTTVVSSPMPVSSLEGLIIGETLVGINQATRVSELWQIDLQSSETHLLLSSAPGAVFDFIRQGCGRDDVIYVTEMRDHIVGKPIWQLHMVDLAAGTIASYFDDFVPGSPDLLDVSFMDKWLRVRVSDPEQPLLRKLWFINVHSGDVVIDEQRYPGFAWSPTDPDTYAFTQSSVWSNHDPTYSVRIKKVGKDELEDEVFYKRTDWGTSPRMIWSSSEPNQIYYFVLGSVYIVDLIEGSWTEVATNLPTAPGIDLFLSSSGEWLATSSLGKVEVGEMRYFDGGSYEIGVQHDHNYRILNSQGDCACIAVSDEDGSIHLYSFEDEPRLLFSLSQEDYSPPIPGFYPQLAIFHSCI